jgi:hypothetical protein
MITKYHCGDEWRHHTHILNISQTTMSKNNRTVLLLASLAAALIFIIGISFAKDQRHRDEIDDLQAQIYELVNVLHDQRNLDSLSRELTPGGTHPFTYASDFGVVGDSTTDDTSALQAAIDAAAANNSGGTVILPKGTFLTKYPLVIPGGVTVKGQGYGSSPLAVQFDAGASTIAYCGTDYAVKLDGHAASLQDMAVYDWRYPVGSECDNMKAAGGVLIDADNKGLESITMSNVLIYWFMEGASLTLRASNGGGIAYSNFQNIRIRHAHTGISLQADGTSFVK